MTAANKPKTKLQKFYAWHAQQGEHACSFHAEECAWMAGYLAGYRARQYEGDLRGRVQRADHRPRSRRTA